MASSALKRSPALTPVRDRFFWYPLLCESHSEKSLRGLALLPLTSSAAAIKHHGMKEATN